MHSSEALLHPEEFWQQRHVIESEINRPSLVIHHDVDVIGGIGFPLQNGRCLIEAGDGLGWGAEHIAQMQNECANFPPEELTRLDESHGKIDVLLSFPGGYTYGHWPIDIAARIERAVSVFELDRLAFIVPGPQQPWMRFHLDAYSISPDAVIVMSERQRYRSATLALPLVRLSAYLPPSPHGRSLARLKAYGHRLASKRGQYAERIFVRHRAQTSIGHRKTLANEDEIAKELQKLGFLSICPADMTIDEQISAFADARLIVGETSSALHNIIYSSDAHLIVLNSPTHKARLNLSLCKLLGHTCTYIFGTDSDDGKFTCDLHALKEAISSQASRFY